jgi:L-lactate dehydrogenase complex protein LldG
MNGTGPAMADDSRLAILARVRDAQIRAFIPKPKAGLPDRLAYPSRGLPERLARLKAEFELLGVETHVEDTEADVRARVQGLIGGLSVLSWDAEHLPYGAGQCLAGERVCYGRDDRETQGRADIGLTGCENALAETGTLAVQSGPGRPRTASLLPITHVVLIRRADILFGMGEFFDKLNKSAALPYLVFITGPSRTADIELSLTLGVHGPGRLVAIIGP